MKIPVCLLILISAGPLLAQAPSGASGVRTGGGSSGGAPFAAGGGQNQGTAGVSSSGGSRVQQPLGGTTPALGSPVRSTPATTSPLTTTPANQTPAGVTDSAGATTSTDLIVSPQQGIPPADPFISPPTNAPAGAITNLLPQQLNQQDEITDPAGAAAGQSAAGVSAIVPGQARSQSAQGTTLSADNTVFADQVRATTAVNGSSQVAFPQQNALVTIISQNGSLTLRGNVSNAQQRQSIEDAVRGIAAGTFIDNQIEVDSGSSGQSTGGGTTIVP